MSVIDKTRLSNVVKIASKRYVQAIAVLSLMITAVLVPSFFLANAVHDDNMFELGPGLSGDEGGKTNILCDSSAANGPDWGCIFDSSGTVVNLFGGVAAAFEKDPTSQSNSVDFTTFSGAGTSNKNNDPISTADCASRSPPLTGSACSPWHWDAGNVPAKDDFSNGYAYAKVTPTGHLLLYAGFERIEASGDSHVDIEFLQFPIALDEATPCNDPGPDTTPCSFTGTRTVGDIVVSMDFLTGGTLGTVEFHVWNGQDYCSPAGASGCPGIAKLTGQGCNVADTLCGFNNGGTINGGPWPNFDRHGATITNLDTNAFTEFGADVTALAAETPCISTLMGKTRSSGSFTAELKDFASPTPFPICSAAISIAPDDVNEVGQPHTFTVTVSKVAAGVSSPAPDGTVVTVSLMDANGAVSNIISNNCASPGTVGGQCSITFTSNTAGRVTGRATANVNIGGVLFPVATDGTGGTGNAVKIFVDARISIAPDDVNSITETHTFTVMVTQNLGDGAGFVTASVGHVKFALTTTSGTAVAIVDTATSTCDDAGDNLDNTGKCTIVFTSSTPGTVIGHANVTLTTPTTPAVTLFRETNNVQGNSGDATKIFIAGSLSWTKVDNAGNLLGGATFRVTRTHSFDPLVDTPDVSFDVTDNSAPDQDPDPGEFLITGLVLGRYEVKEITPPPGFEADPTTKVAVLTLLQPNQAITIAFSNPRPILKLTGFGYQNTLTSTPSQCPPTCTVSGSVTYTIKIHNYGNADATIVSGSFDVTVGGSPAGSLSLSGTVVQGGDATFTLTVIYNNVADGTVIAASLSAVLYSTSPPDGSTRTVNGTPASISFTAQAD